MCTGGRLVADVTLGTTDRPDVPPELEASLTTSTDERWALWAHKVARPAGDVFFPMTGGPTYPADATARCRHGLHHPAPDPTCTCGFHALSAPLRSLIPRGLAHLEVALTGRVLVFEWPAGGVLFRAERQTVARVHAGPTSPDDAPLPPSDPGGRLARLLHGLPAGSEPMRLELPTAVPPLVTVQDDVGLCALTPPQRVRPGRVLTSA
jgi:hypothetical protein